jgi:tRNA (Thr-GGU) A37 N-methylase
MSNTGGFVLHPLGYVHSTRSVAIDPRGRKDWPRIGIFAQRGRVRPNRLGVTVCRLVRVDGLVLHVEGLDAIDGTPVLDIKPVMSGFLPRGELREPEWARAIMASYWTESPSG